MHVTGTVALCPNGVRRTKSEPTSWVGVSPNDPPQRHRFNYKVWKRRSRNHAPKPRPEPTARSSKQKLFMKPNFGLAWKHWRHRQYPRHGEHPHHGERPHHGEWGVGGGVCAACAQSQYPEVGTNCSHRNQASDLHGNTRVVTGGAALRGSDPYPRSLASDSRNLTP